MQYLKSPQQDTRELLDVRAVAELIGCSSRNVYRLAESGQIPSPVKIGGLVRWNRDSLDDWIDAGCPHACNGKAVADANA